MNYINLLMQGRRRADMAWYGQQALARLKALSLTGFEHQVFLVLQNLFRIWKLWKSKPTTGRRIRGASLVAQVQGHRIGARTTDHAGQNTGYLRSGY